MRVPDLLPDGARWWDANEAPEWGGGGAQRDLHSRATRWRRCASARAAAAARVAGSLAPLFGSLSLVIVNASSWVVLKVAIPPAQRVCSSCIPVLRAQPDPKRAAADPQARGEGTAADGRRADARRNVDMSAQTCVINCVCLLRTPCAAGTLDWHRDVKARISNHARQHMVRLRYVQYQHGGRACSLQTPCRLRDTLPHSTTPICPRISSALRSELVADQQGLPDLPRCARRPLRPRSSGRTRRRWPRPAARSAG
eukprot:COSAG06_NODE_23_length_33072_cov_44.622327_27_plen_255_part_00